MLLCNKGVARRHYPRGNGPRPGAVTGESYNWSVSSGGRTLALQAGCRGFEALTDHKMNSKNKGNVGEAKAVSDLISKGYDVALPFGDNLPFDIIAITPTLQFIKVQVKYCSLKDGKIRLRNQKMSCNTKRTYTTSYTVDEVDVFAVYCPDNDTVLYVDSKEVVNTSEFAIRFDSPKKKMVRW